MKNNINKEENKGAERVIVVAPDNIKQMETKRYLRSALARCNEVVPLLKDFGVQPTTDIIHECTQMSRTWEQVEDVTPRAYTFHEDDRTVKQTVVASVWHDCPHLNQALDGILAAELKNLTPREARTVRENFNDDADELREKILKLFNTSYNIDLKNIVIKYVEVKDGEAKAVDDAEERIDYDTAIKVDTPESIAAYDLHRKSAELLNTFIGTLINADRISVVSNIQQLFNVDPISYQVTPAVIDYKIFCDK